MLADPLREDISVSSYVSPESPWMLGSEVTEVMEVMENEELALCKNHVGESIEFDLWMCCEFHHWSGVFVFEKGSMDVLLRYEPVRQSKGQIGLRSSQMISCG